MKILFFMRHPGYTRNFESTLRLLAERGHQVHLAFDKGERSIAPGVAETLAAEYANLTHGRAPGRENDGWKGLVRDLRLAIDYLRYLEPRYREAAKLRQRAELRAPRIVRHIVNQPLVRNRVGLALVGRALRLLEHAVPNSPKVARFIRAHRPDIVLVTPLVDLASAQPDYVRGAHALGVRTGLCVYSWDNLTNKGLIQHIPDMVTVWNDAQKREAVELHGVAPSQVVVTGAEAYDHWFNWAPSTTRAEFCARVGLPDDRPFLLYLCSSYFIAPQEASFVLAWLRQLRNHDGRRPREVGVLIRPHPQNATQWAHIDLAEFGAAAVWPREGANPVQAEAKAEFYDSIYHAAAVVGVNTSALIESAIVGRPVYTLLAPEFRETQGGTLHFQHLLRVNGGLLHVAETFRDHAAQLEAALAKAGERDERGRRFLEAFVRPHGLEVAATPKLVEAIEEAAAAPVPAPRSRPRSAALLRPLLAPFAGYQGWRRRWSERRGALARVRLGFKGLCGLEKPSVRPSAARLKRAISAGARRSLAKGPVHRVASEAVLPALSVATAKLARGVTSAGRDGVGGPVGIRQRRDSDSVERTWDGLAHEPSTGIDVPELALKTVRAALRPVRKLDTPILAGPWMSEVGYELLYWVPFLRWVTTKEPWLAERLVVVSRGGAGHWYRDIAPRYVDVFDYLSPAEFRDKREQTAPRTRSGRAEQKQFEMSPFERELVDRVAHGLGAREPHVLHPSLMYQPFRQLLKQDAIPRIRMMSVYRPMDRPELGVLAGRLPDEYVAVKFYYNAWFPETEENREFVASILRSLTKTTNVVLLNTGLRLDDHWDFEAAASDRVFRVDEAMVPTNNLEVQTIAISRARAFIGTYGGLSYLPPFLGVPSLCFYSFTDPKFPQHHLDLAQRIFRGPDWAPFVALETAHVDLVRLASELSMATWRAQ